MPLCSANQYYEEGKEFVEQALSLDLAGNAAAAIFYYTEAANVLLSAVNDDPA